MVASVRRPVVRWHVAPYTRVGWGRGVRCFLTWPPRVRLRGVASFFRAVVDKCPNLRHVGRMRKGQDVAVRWSTEEPLWLYVYGKTGDAGETDETIREVRVGMQRQRQQQRQQQQQCTYARSPVVLGKRRFRRPADWCMPSGGPRREGCHVSLHSPVIT